MTDLLTQLKNEVGRRNITQVAVALGIPRCTLSLVVNGKYPANPKNILARFEAVFCNLHCPHLNRELTRPECLAFQTRPRPSNPLGLQHYRACRHCINNPDKGER